MAKKRYISLTGIQYTFPVRVNGKSVWVAFKGNGTDYETSNKEVQKAIEASERFRNKEIGLSGKHAEESVVPKVAEESPKVNTHPAEAVQEVIPPTTTVVENESPIAEEERPEVAATIFPDVTDINGAAAVLKAEPYKVHHFSLRGKDAILAKAKELNVAFPNWNDE